MGVIDETNTGYLWGKVKSYVHQLLGSALGGDIGEVKEGEVRDLLWTNPSPTAEFGAQTLSVDSTGYEIIEVVYAIWSGTSQTSARFVKDSNGYGMGHKSERILYLSYSKYAGRTITINNSAITFNDCTDNTGATLNAYMVPIAIYGIRKSKIAIGTELVRGIVKDLMWTNPDTSAVFPATTIPLTLSGYDEVEIFYRLNNNRADTHSVAIRIADGAGILTGSFTDANAFYDRRCNVTPTYVYFGPAWGLYTSSNSKSEDNALCIPVAIYGVKKSNIAVGTELVDYPVEEGTSGIWHYKKYASGIAECWGVNSQAISSMLTWGTVKYSPLQTVNYPFTFVSIESCPYSVEANGGITVGVVSNGGFGTTTTTPPIAVWRPNDPGGSFTVRANYYVKGRWK